MLASSVELDAASERENKGRPRKGDRPPPPPLSWRPRAWCIYYVPVSGLREDDGAFHVVLSLVFSSRWFFFLSPIDPVASDNFRHSTSAQNRFCGAITVLLSGLFLDGLWGVEPSRRRWPLRDLGEPVTFRAYFQHSLLSDFGVGRNGTERHTGDRWDGRDARNPPRTPDCCFRFFPSFPLLFFPLAFECFCGVLSSIFQRAWKRARREITSAGKRALDTSWEGTNSLVPLSYQQPLGGRGE